MRRQSWITRTIGNWGAILTFLAPATIVALAYLTMDRLTTIPEPNSLSDYATAICGPVTHTVWDCVSHSDGANAQRFLVGIHPPELKGRYTWGIATILSWIAMSGLIVYAFINVATVKPEIAYWYTGACAAWSAVLVALITIRGIQDNQHSWFLLELLKFLPSRDGNVREIQIVLLRATQCLVVAANVALHLAIVALVFRTNRDGPDDLARRISSFHALMLASSIGWVFVALNSRALLQWPIALLAQPRQAIATDMATGVVVLLIGYYTVFIVVTYLCAALAFSVQAENLLPKTIYSRKERAAWLAQHDLSIASQPQIARFLALFAPLVAGSFDKLVESLLSGISAGH